MRLGKSCILRVFAECFEVLRGSKALEHTVNALIRRSTEYHVHGRRLDVVDCSEYLDEDVKLGPVRNLNAISEMLTESGLPAAVKERSIQVFTALAEAEAQTHGSTIDKVYFFTWL